MTEIIVAISDEQAELLNARAEEAGVTVEEMARVGLEAWLKTSEEFQNVAVRVLEKNAELYRRLS